VFSSTRFPPPHEKEDPLGPGDRLGAFEDEPSREFTLKCLLCVSTKMSSLVARSL